MAKYANRKSQSFGVFLVFGLLGSWIVALIVALVIKDRSAGSRDYLDQLQKLGELRAAGVLSDEEFAAQKARVIPRA